MKSVFLAIACIISTVSFAQSETCTPEQVQILNRAVGPDSVNVRSVLMLETPNFTCEVTPHYYAFPADCGRFTYVEYEFKVNVAATTIEAIVQDGGISCTGVKKTVLSKSNISK